MPKQTTDWDITRAHIEDITFSVPFLVRCTATWGERRLLLRLIKEAFIRKQMFDESALLRQLEKEAVAKPAAAVVPQRRRNLRLPKP